ncbi:MAG: hypothetical protein KGK15_17160 [Burkholderiales bacterium]|nr:hypothetical protein [Burkholderiales bacterium]MDE2611380.1 hypothetical protein [Burkholderiales bacterium]
MKTTLQFILFMAIAFMVIVIAILLGNLGAWYFAWLVGTAMIVLVAAAGGALLDTQEEVANRKAEAEAASRQQHRPAR